MAFTIAFFKLFAWSLYLVAPLLLIFALVIIILGQVATRIEKWGKFDGLYWSFITATTVGYGDIRPKTKFTKALSILIALTGMLFTGIIIAVAINAATISIERHIDPSVVEKIKSSLD